MKKLILSLIILLVCSFCIVVFSSKKHAPKDVFSANKTKIYTNQTPPENLTSSVQE